MPDRALLRVGSASAILGAILLLASNILYPRSADPGNAKAVLENAAKISAGLHTGTSIGLLLGIVLALGGFLALYRSIANQPAASWARLGYGAAVISTALFSIVTGVDGSALKNVADAWTKAPAAYEAAATAVVWVDYGFFTAWIMVFGVSNALYGAAVAYSDGYPQWLGWLALLLGIALTAIGLAQAYNGPSHNLDLLFGIFSVAVTVWLFVMGILMWRKATAAP